MSERSNVLLVWELGGALGHVARLAPIARHLRETGREVRMALALPPRAGRVPEGVDLLPVPVMPPTREPLTQPVSMADVLYNAGVCERDRLAGQVRTWRGLFSLAAPDAVVLDYSPTALLALQGMDIPVVQVGTGFACPPAVSPLPDLRDWQDHYPDRIRATEARVLAALNAQLESQRQPGLACVGELFGRVRANVLATFPELDHYPDHERGEYWGTWSGDGGTPPAWPDGDGPRVFAYLKPFRGLHRVLDELAARGLPSVVHVGGGFDGRRWQQTPVRVSAEPLDMAAVARDCDIAITNAGHGTTAAMLLAGVPLLQMPIQVEQYHNARATERIGAGIHVTLGDRESFSTALDRLLNEPAYRAAAAAFARRHADHDPDEAVRRLVDRIVSLAAGSAGRGGVERDGAG